MPEPKVTVEILKVLEDYGIELRKVGKEYLSKCPFHTDKTPSFHVSEEKNVFYCFACNFGGDAINFVQRIERVGYVAALRILGIDRNNRPRPRVVSSNARQIADWANTQFLRAQAILRELNQRTGIAQEIRWEEELELLDREIQLIEVLAEDLQSPKLAIELNRQAKAVVESLLANAPQKPLDTFPELTPEYWARVQSYVRGEA